MKIICVNYLLLLVNFAFKLADADSTPWPLDNQDYSTVLPRPMDSTKPTVAESKNSSISSNATKSTNSPIGQQNDRLVFGEHLTKLENSNQSNNESKEIDGLNVNQSSLNEPIFERTRTSRRLASDSTTTFGIKLASRKPVDVNRNQSIANVDLQANMTVAGGRSAAFDEQLGSKSSDSFLDDKYLQHLSAYDRIKIKNDKFSYDNFFGLYDHVPENILEDEEAKSHSSKNTYEENQQADPYHLIPYKQTYVLPLAPQYQQYDDQLQQLQQQQQYIPQQNNLPYDHPYAFVAPSRSTIQNFRKYQKQRVKELMHRPVSEMFAGKFKPYYEPKYKLEAPQRSHQQTGLGELFIVLGPLVILPLLSSFALSTFTTLYVTKSLISKPASATSARHKQFTAGKLLNDDNQTLFGSSAHSVDELVYHPFNASDFDIQLLKTRNNQRSKKTNRKREDKILGNQTFSEHKGEPDEHIERQLDESTKVKYFKSKDDLKVDGMKGLKRSKRYLRHDLTLKELGLDVEERLISERRARRVRRWNEVLWTKPKQLQQTPWLPLTKKLTRQPRNSLHNKLYIVRPTKKVYRKMLKGPIKQVDKHINSAGVQLGGDNHDFNEPANLVQFAINDAIAHARQIANLESKFDTNESRFEQKFDNTPHQSASSPTPTYLNFSTKMNPNVNAFTNFNNHAESSTYQPKMYNLRTNGATSQNGTQIIKRNSVNNLVVGDKPLNSFQTVSGSNSPVNSQHTYRSISSSFLNPFNAFTLSNNHTHTASDSQVRSKNARKLDLDNKSWDKDVFDTIPLDVWSEEYDPSKNHLKQKDRHVASTLNSDLDVVQKYLKQTRPDGEYNDEIIATYLTCNGLLSESNQCLQRLVCQYVDTNVKMPELEKEVASLIIYAILKNKYIDNQVKQGMRQAAQIAHRENHGQCSQYQCLRIKPRK